MQGGNKGKVSIICVTKNADNYLERCLYSIFEQRYTNIEIIIMDGNSNDGTVDILKKWNHKISFWKSEPDGGLYDAMNKALDYISGDWVYFIGADDILLPEFSDFVENELINPYTIYYSNVFFKKEKHKGPLSDYLRVKNGGILHQSMIYPAIIFTKYKYRYDLKYKIAADVALNIRLNGNKKFKFLYKDYTIAVFNESGVSSMYRDKAFYEDLPKLALKNFGVLVWLRLQMRYLKYWLKKTRDDERIDL